MSRYALRLAPVAWLAAAIVAAPRLSWPAPASATGGHTDAPAAAANVPPELALVLERAGRYVADDQERLNEVAATETRIEEAPEGTTIRSLDGTAPAAGRIKDVCTGELTSHGAKLLGRRTNTGDEKARYLKCHRAAEADVVFVRPEGERGFRVYRDVFAVNGQKVRSGELRLQRLFADHPVPAATSSADALTEQSDASFNVGPRPRDVSSPLLAQLLLHPENQRRLAWSAKGKRRFGRVEARELAFEETARPTLLRQPDGSDLPASGRVWIDVSLGTVVRSEAELRYGARARAIVSTEFRPDRDLSMWVPVEMQERYEDVEGYAPVFRGRTEVSTRYTAFHRFSPWTTRPAEAARVPSSPELVELLRRAGESVADYERAFSDLVALETYTQNDGVRKRTTKADLVFARLAGDIPWASYRDVFEVDGHKPQERSEALARLISAAPENRPELSRQLLLAGAAYNIGPTRTANLPTLALSFLLPRNQQRFAFRLGERATLESTEVVELVFAETARPTLVTGSRGTDLPVAGRFWINPSRGTVVRSEIEFDFGIDSEARVAVDFRAVPALAMWVPSEMRERFADAPGADVRTFARPFDGVARYSGFRRFTVRSEGRPEVPGQ